MDRMQLSNRIVYRKLGGRELMLDLAKLLPQGAARPAVVFLCGNG
jgi:hypothetical protein